MTCTPTARRIVLGFIALTAAIALLAGCSRQDAAPPPPPATEKLVLGAENGLLASAVWVAERKGYFKAQGLELRIVRFDSGRAALENMLEQGGLDLVTVAQTPVMFNSFNRADYALIAGMVTAVDDVKLVARRDTGIAQVADLKGKRIGATRGSTGHYFLSAFLRTNGVGMGEVEMVDMKTDALSQALADGKVAAISTWEPHATKTRQLLGANALAFDSHGIFREDFYFVAKRDTIVRHPHALERFLKAIDQANQDMAANPGEAIGIVAAHLNIERASIEALWSVYSFRLFLDQTILLSLEDEARWAIDNALTDKKTLPNYLEFVSPDVLKAVKPAAVTLID